MECGGEHLIASLSAISQQGPNPSVCACILSSESVGGTSKNSLLPAHNGYNIAPSMPMYVCSYQNITTKVNERKLCSWLGSICSVCFFVCVYTVLYCIGPTCTCTDTDKELQVTSTSTCTCIIHVHVRVCMVVAAGHGVCFCS